MGGAIEGVKAPSCWFVPCQAEMHPQCMYCRAKEQSPTALESHVALGCRWPAGLIGTKHHALPCPPGATWPPTPAKCNPPCGCSASEVMPCCFWLMGGTPESQRRSSSSHGAASPTGAPVWRRSQNLTTPSTPGGKGAGGTGAGRGREDRGSKQMCVCVCVCVCV